MRGDIESFLRTSSKAEFLAGSMCPWAGQGSYEFAHIDWDMLETDVIADALRRTIANRSTACIVTFEEEDDDVFELAKKCKDLIMTTAMDENGILSIENGIKIEGSAFFTFVMSNLYPEYHPRKLPYSALVFTDDIKLRDYPIDSEIALKVRLATLLRVAKAYNPEMDIELVKQGILLDFDGESVNLSFNPKIVEERDALVMMHYSTFGYNRFFARPFDSSEILRLVI